MKFNLIVPFETVRRNGFEMQKVGGSINCVFSSIDPSGGVKVTVALTPLRSIEKEYAKKFNLPIYPH